MEQYGSLSHDEERYPLSAISTAKESEGYDANKPTVLVTGGVHGYVSW